MTQSEYLNELVEEVISAATDYGKDSSEKNEKALGAASDMLYDALKLLIP